MPQPNILLFMVDQLTSFVLSTYGGTVCKTPNIDGLATRSTVFENAYCAYPLCAPSRASMMTGRLASRIGVYDNGADFPTSFPTFAHYLRDAGYYTCLSGKMHFVGPDQFHGFEERLTTEIYPADLSWTPDPMSDGVHGFGVSTIDTVKDAAPVARSMQIDYDEDVTHHAVREIYQRARSDDQRPFLLTVSLTQPHDPYVTTNEFWDLYEDAAIDAPKVPPFAVEDRDPQSKDVYYHYSQDKCPLSEADYRRARRGYYGMVSHIDALFGQVIHALEASGLDKNTVVIFTSDHGDMIGERGMWYKKTLFEAAVKVPLILSIPGRLPGRSMGPVSLLDIFPTLLEIAGIDLTQVQTAFDGTSLLPIMDGAERLGPIPIEHIDGGTRAPRICLRDGSKKLTLSKAYPPQLFDLDIDPDELTDLAGTGDPDEARLTALAQEFWDLEKLGKDVARSQTERRAVDRALAKGREEVWDYAPRPMKQNTDYVRRGDTFLELEHQRYLHYSKEN